MQLVQRLNATELREDVHYFCNKAVIDRRLRPPEKQNDKILAFWHRSKMAVTWFLQLF